MILWTLLSAMDLSVEASAHQTSVYFSLATGRGPPSKTSICNARLLAPLQAEWQRFGKKSKLFRFIRGTKEKIVVHHDRATMTRWVPRGAPPARQQQQPKLSHLRPGRNLPSVMGRPVSMELQCSGTKKWVKCHHENLLAGKIWWSLPLLSILRDQCLAVPKPKVDKPDPLRREVYHAERARPSINSRKSAVLALFAQHELV